MKAPREWNDERELFEEIAEALEASTDYDAGMMEYIYNRPQRGNHGESGTLEFTTKDGRRFALDLSEIIN